MNIINKIKEGSSCDDFLIVKRLYRRSNQTYFLVKCNICGNEKEISDSNIKKQNMKHSKFNCKNEYYREFIGEIFGDYIVDEDIYLNGKKGYAANVKCLICGHTKTTPSGELGLKKSKHTASNCGDDYYRNEIGKIYGDYKILSFKNKYNGYIYFNVECTICGTKGIRSLLSLKKYEIKHGYECFKMIEGEYKDEFERRFANMIQRCTNSNNNSYLHYGNRGIRVEYEHLIDFYIDFIDDFTEHAKIYGVRNTTFDRINVNGNYAKDNLRLACQTIQSTNTTRKHYFILEKDDQKVLCDNAIYFGEYFNINGRAIGNLVRKQSKSSYGWRLVAKSQSLEELENMNVTTKLITT